MTKAFDVKKVSYSYDNDLIIDKISFSVNKGVFFIIIGPNGSGKTTLMSLLSSIFKPDHGDIEVMGKSLKSYTRKEIAKCLALVSQSIPDNFPFTVYELVSMGRSPHMGILGFENDQDIEIVNKALNFTSMQYLANRKFNKISGGEKQRAFIARAICQKPDIILLDEPTSALDLAHQVKVMDLLEQLKYQNNTTVVMVSHDINLSAMYADVILLLDKGNIVSIGTPNNVLKFKNLEKAYKCPLLVDKNPLGDFPRVTLVPEKYNII